MKDDIMLLSHKLPDPQLNLSLELFLRILKDFFGDDLLSVVLFGSVVFDDLSPGYGDLDFLAVIKDDLSEERLQQLIELRRPLRSGHYGIYCHMIEGPFLPVRMLDPKATGNTICWGTGGERVWDRNKLGWFVREIIHRHGIIIHGEDVRDRIPRPTRSDLFAETHLACDDIKRHGGDRGLHSIDWLLLAARLLLWLREDRFASKSDAADWALTHAEGSWRNHLVIAKVLRKNPCKAEQTDVKEWLDSLSAPVGEACIELERELRRSSV